MTAVMGGGAGHLGVDVLYSGYTQTHTNAHKSKCDLLLMEIDGRFRYLASLATATLFTRVSQNFIKLDVQTSALQVKVGVYVLTCCTPGSCWRLDFFMLLPSLGSCSASACCLDYCISWRFHTKLMWGSRLQYDILMCSINKSVAPLRNMLSSGFF